MNTPIRKIVIVGDSFVAYWAGIFIKKKMPAISVTILPTSNKALYENHIECDFLYYLKLIGVGESDLIKYADANFLYAQNFLGWSETGKSYFHSCESIDYSFDVVELNQCLLKVKQANVKVDVNDYSLYAFAVKYGKSLTSFGQIPNKSRMCINVKSLEKIMISMASDIGITIVPDKIKTIVEAPSIGIECVLLESGEKIKGDFFIDSTGMLIEDILGISYESWQNHLPCNTKKTLVVANANEPLMASFVAELTSFGWLKRTSLQSKSYYEFIYSNEYNLDVDDKLIKLFADAPVCKFRPGMRERLWEKNCLALGHAAVCVDHFDYSSLSLSAMTIQRFLSLWPGYADMSSTRNEFNRLMRVELESVRDFHCLHYLLAKKEKTIMSRHLEKIKIPSSLEYRLVLFQDSGKQMAEESTIIDPREWTQLMIGLDYWPKNYDVVSDNYSLSQYISWLQDINQKIQSQLNLNPDYNDYMKNLYHFYLNSNGRFS